MDYLYKKILKSCLLLLLSITLLTGCFSTSQVPAGPRIISQNEKEALSSILSEALDTIIVSLDSSYQTVEYAYLPEDLRNRLQSQILEMNIPLRPDSAYFKGMLDAQNDIKNGLFMHYTYGLDVLVNGVEIRPVIDTILKYKYAIKTSYLAGCMVNKCIEAYKMGYDKLSVPILNKFFNCDVYRTVWLEAVDTINKRYGSKEYMPTK